MTGYSPGGWGDFFLAAAAATAALSGLIFVGLSVNIATLLDIDKRVGSNFLTGRAIEALVALLDVLAVSLVALTPTIDRGVLAGFILLAAAVSAISPARALHASRARGALSAGTASRVLIASALTVKPSRRRGDARGRSRWRAGVAAGGVRAGGRRRRDQRLDPARRDPALAVTEVRRSATQA